jgi:hypothetical protein
LPLFSTQNDFSAVDRRKIEDPFLGNFVEVW